VKTSEMNPIRSLLIWCLVASVSCNNNFMKDSNVTQKSSDLEAFGKAVSSILVQTVNEFLIAKMVIFGYADLNHSYHDDATMKVTRNDPNRTSYEFNQEINEIMRNSEGKLVIEVTHFKHHVNVSRNPENFYIGLCKGVCLLLFEDIPIFHYFRRQYSDNEKDSNIMINFILGATTNEIQILHQTETFIRIAATSAIANEFTIAGDGEFYDLVEINQNIEGGICNKFSMLKINRFSKTNMEWEKPLQRLEERKSFNGCEMGFQLFPNQAIVTKTEDGKEWLSGVYADIMDLVSEMGNFSAYYEKVTSFQFNSLIAANENGEGSEEYFNETYFKNVYYTGIVNAFSSFI